MSKKKKTETRRTLKEENGERWFVGENHDGDEQLYDWMEVGPRTTSELRTHINQRGVNWITALAADHFNIPATGYSAITPKVIREYAQLKIRSDDERVPWKVKAQTCTESAATACRLIDKGDFEAAMLYVASTIHCAHGAYSDKQHYDAMREESREAKAKNNKEEAFKARKEFAAEKAEEFLTDRINKDARFPNKTEIAKFLKKKYGDRVPNKDVLVKVIVKAAKNLTVQLPRNGPKINKSEV